MISDGFFNGKKFFFYSLTGIAVIEVSQKLFRRPPKSLENSLTKTPTKGRCLQDRKMTDKYIQAARKMVQA